MNSHCEKVVSIVKTKLYQTDCEYYVSMVTVYFVCLCRMRCLLIVVMVAVGVVTVQGVASRGLMKLLMELEKREVRLYIVFNYDVAAFDYFYRRIVDYGSVSPSGSPNDYFLVDPLNISTPV